MINTSLRRGNGKPDENGTVQAPALTFRPVKTIIRPVMQRIMVKSKIHRAVITGADLHYEGSLAIDSLLLGKADIFPGEQVHVYNVNTGHRLITYAIPAAPGSGTIMLNGAAARLGAVGDHVIICTFAQMENAEAVGFKPRVILVDAHNRAKASKPKR